MCRMKRIDMVDQQFGKLMVLESAGCNKRREAMWKCQCDCNSVNSIRIVCGFDLRSGRTKSCGCLQREQASNTHRIDLVGQRFGRLLVLEYAYTKNWRAYWKCQCDCDNEIIVRGDSLKSGKSKSCGCLQKERVSEANYNPNLTDEEREAERKYPEYQEWRTAVYERDNYTCQCCGRRGGKLAAHHLESYRDNPELRTLLENGITLCKECHKNFHHQYGYGNTREQFEEFLFAQKEYRDVEK